MIAELSDMGFEIVARPFAEPTDSDLLVKVTPVGGWDMTRYLQKCTDSVYCGEVGPTRHLIILLLQGSLAWVRDGRLKTLFNDIRQKNGYPPSKQFS